MKEKFNMQMQDFRRKCAIFACVVRVMFLMAVIFLPLVFTFENKVYFTILVVIDAIVIIFTALLLPLKYIYAFLLLDKLRKGEDSNEQKDANNIEETEITSIANPKYTDEYASSSDDFEFDVMGFKFDDVNQMKIALSNGNFDYDAYYQIDQKGYVFVCIDEDEDEDEVIKELEKFGGKAMEPDEEDRVIEITTVYNSGMFVFYTSDNIKEFVRFSEVQSNIIMMEGCYYVDCSNYSLKDRKRFGEVVSECFGEELEDMYEIKVIQDVIEQVGGKKD